MSEDEEKDCAGIVDVAARITHNILTRIFFFFFCWNKNELTLSNVSAVYKKKKKTFYLIHILGHPSGEKKKEKGKKEA